MFMKNVLLTQTIVTSLLLVITITTTATYGYTFSAKEANLALKRRDIGDNSGDDQTGNNNNKINKKFYSNKEEVLEDEDDDDDDEDAGRVGGRFQRTDSHHNTRYHVYMNDNRKLKHHYQAPPSQHQPASYANGFENYLQRNRNLFLSNGLINSNGGGGSGGHEEADLFAEDIKKFEDEMKINELRQFIAENSRFAAEKEAAAAQPSEMLLRQQGHAAAAAAKAVKAVQVKEKLMREDEYNRQFESKDPSNGEGDASNPFFGQEVSVDTLKAGLSQQAINESPSMVNKQQAQPSIDPSLSSKIESLKQQNDYLFMFVLAGCILAGVVALIAAGVCWYTVHKSYKSNPAEYGVKIGKFNSSSLKSNSSSSGDRRLAQSAQMYHYQHQKQQMIAMEKANNDTKPDNSDNSEGETEEGDYTVYECPGLAPTGEMEVKNPLFKEDFSQSLNNIHSSTLPPPPAYSSLSATAETNEPAAAQQQSSEVPKSSGSVETTEAPTTTTTTTPKPDESQTTAAAATTATETTAVSINLNDDKQQN